MPGKLKEKVSAWSLLGNRSGKSQCSAWHAIVQWGKWLQCQTVVLEGPFIIGCCTERMGAVDGTSHDYTNYVFTSEQLQLWSCLTRQGDSIEPWQTDASSLLCNTRMKSAVLQAPPRLFLVVIMVYVETAVTVAWVAHNSTTFWKGGNFIKYKYKMYSVSMLHNNTWLPAPLTEPGWTAWWQPALSNKGIGHGWSIGWKTMLHLQDRGVWLDGGTGDYMIYKRFMVL